jgi:GGDEF domain-containing protein
MTALAAPIEPARLEQLLRLHKSGVVVLLELQLTDINGTRGWAAGDRVLAAFASMLEQALRAHDTTVRSAGQQFVLLLPGIEAPDCAGLLTRLHALWERWAPYPCTFLGCAVPVESTGRAAFQRAIRENSAALTRLRWRAADEVHTPEVPSELAVRDLKLALLSVRALLRATHPDEVDEIIDSAVDALGFDTEQVRGDDRQGPRHAVLARLRDDASITRRRLAAEQRARVDRGRSWMPAVGEA